MFTRIDQTLCPLPAGDALGVLACPGLEIRAGMHVPAGCGGDLPYLRAGEDLRVPPNVLRLVASQA